MQFRSFHEWRAHRANNPRARVQFQRFGELVHNRHGDLRQANSNYVDILHTEGWARFWFDARTTFERSQESIDLNSWSQMRAYQDWSRNQERYLEWMQEINRLEDEATELREQEYELGDADYGISQSRHTQARRFFDGGVVLDERADASGKFFGLELEFELSRGRRGDFVDIVREHWSQKFCDIKHDGSLADGLELATQPMTLAHFRTLDLHMLEQLRANGARAWDTSTCGIHIHLERGTFATRAHVWRFAKFIFGNRHQLRPIVGRDSSSYVQWGADSFQVISNVLKGVRFASTGHYSAVNLDNNATIEVRVFKSTLRAATLTRYVEFLFALVEYTRDLTILDVTLGALDLHAFTSWLSVRSGDYPTLVQSLRNPSTESREAA
jgi:hypothetical protein